ncbi:GUN4 domain-containing protein, partial [Microcystis aeruginosa BLCCF158]
AETMTVMLQAANRTKKGWLRVEDMDNFPCEDLRTIDQLWVKYSGGRFGFSVQAKIYRELGGTREYNERVWNAFGDRVGWRVNNSWIYYRDVTFDLKAPLGHLPVGGSSGGWWWWEMWGFSSLASRLVKCNI